MKIPILSALILIAGSTAMAQSYPKMVGYKSVLQPALILPLPNSTDMAEQTILSKLKETGYKPETRGKLFWKKNKQEGFYMFPGVQLPDLPNQKLDLYFKVDAQNSNSDPQNHSAITLLVSKGSETFVNPQTDTAMYHATQDFLNSFVSETAAFNLGKDLDGQRQKVKDTEKRWQDLRNQQEDAKKKIAEMEDNIKKWQDEEVKQKSALDSAKAAVQTMEAQQSASNTPAAAHP